MFDFPNKANASGLFSAPHYISSAICVLLIALFVFLSRKISDRALLLVTRVLAIAIGTLEVIKIIFKLAIGEGVIIDHWVPLFYCSLFIYALFMCGFGKGVIYKIGCVFLMTGCAIPGLLFLIFPVTSLPDYPYYHFISLHSMLFHSSMVYLGIIYLKKSYVAFSKRSYLYYVIFVSVPILLSLILNPIFDSNLMLIDNPVNLPIELIYQIYQAVPFVYTLGACLLYLTAPYFITLGAFALYTAIKRRKAG